MNRYYPTIAAPASPEYILEVIRDSHRQQCVLDPEADSDIVLTMESTVAEWREACDLVGWRELGRAENEIWGIACSEGDWQSVLEPQDKKTLAAVCQLISTHAVRPTTRPSRHFGCCCAESGIFLTIRSMLASAGADPNNIRPSTRVAQYADKHIEVFLGPISRLAPGALPLVHMTEADGGIISCISLIGLLISVIAGLVGWLPLFIAGIALFFGSIFTEYELGRQIQPARFEFGNLRTFRDLAEAIADADDY